MQKTFEKIEKKIALIEKKEDIKKYSFDKVISFQEDDNTHVANYLNLAELYDIYNQLFLKLYEWIDSFSAEKAFSYEGVDILRAYGKRCFDFLFSFYQKSYAVAKIIDGERPSELWVIKEKEYDAKYPSLNFFIQDFLPASLSLKYFEKEIEKEKVKTVGTKLGLSLAPIGNIARNLSKAIFNKKDNNVLIYSDLNKIPLLMDCLDGRRALFLRERLPLRLISYLLRRRINLCLFSDQHVSPADMNNLSIISESFINRLNDSKNLFSVNNIDFAPYIKKWLASIWKEELKDILQKIKQAHIIFKSFQIKSLLVDEDRTELKNTMVQLSKYYGCVSYVNCHGDPFHRIAYVPLSADYILVWGQAQKDLFIEWGVKKERIIITGCSKYYKYFNIPYDKARQNIISDLRLSLPWPIILIATCPFKPGREIWRSHIAWERLKMIFTVLSGFDNIQVVIKLHPGDDTQAQVSELAAKFRFRRIRIIRDYDSLLLARGTDILITYLSTFSLDGLAYQKPVLLTDSWSIKRYEKLDTFYNGSTEAKLKDSLQGILNGRYKRHIENWKKAVDYCLNNVDESTCERIAEILNRNG